MSASVASVIALALNAVMVVPLAWAAAVHRLRLVAIPYTAVILVVALWQTGVFERASMTKTNVTARVGAVTREAQCKQVMDLLRQSGFAIDRTRPDGPRIIGNGADKLPQQVRDVVAACAAIPPE